MAPETAWSPERIEGRSSARHANASRLLAPTREAPAGDAELFDLLALADTGAPARDRLERLARLVADVLGAPVTVISRTQAQRQRLVACTGLACGAIGDDLELCGHVVSHRLLEVPDVRADRRFRDHPLVAGDAQVRFFAGADLHQPGGGNLGTLCVMDKRPRRLTETECRLMLRLADVVEQELLLQSRVNRARTLLGRPGLVDPDTGLPGADAVEAQARLMLKQAAETGSGVAALAIRPATLHDAEWAGSAESGPELIRAIASRIARHLPEDATLARLEGPWFTALLPVNAGIEDFMASVRGLADLLAKPHDLETGRVRIPCTVGVATVFPGDAAGAEELLSRARRTAEHLCLERAETVGLYTAELDQRALRRQRIATRLPAALADEMLSLHYQPIVSLRDETILGVEALLRWDDEQLGPVAPEELFAVAGEDPNLSRALTHFVLRTALQEARPWAAAGLQLNVNLNALELVNTDIASVLETLLAETGYPAGCLTLELTEESLVPDMKEAADTFAALARQGVGMAIDDFGTGYSSLRYLQRLPARALKIDRSFVADMADNPYSYHLVRGIVDVAGQLGIQVIAEGVETADQQRQLLALGCVAAQGYFLYGPLKAREFSGIVRRWAGATPASPDRR